MSHSPSSSIGTTTSSAYNSDGPGQRSASLKQQAKSSNHINGKCKAPRKRASWACYRCRARKVRCNVMAHGAPCVNCRLDKVQCLFNERRRPRRQTHTNIENKEPETSALDESYNDLLFSSLDISALVNGTINPLDLMNTGSGVWGRASPFAYNGIKDEEAPFAESPKGYQSNWLCQKIAYEDNVQHLNCHLDTGTDSDIQASLFCGHPASKSSFVPQTKYFHLPAYIKPLPDGMNRENIYHLQRTDALSVPDISLRSALLESYIQFVHPYMPVVELHDFIRIVNRNSDQTVSLLLFQAVMFAGSAFVDLAHLITVGFTSRREARKALYQKVKVLYELDYETDRVSLVQSLLLMTYWYETPYDHKDSMHWLGIAISLAYTIGLHRNQEKSSLSVKKQGLWKRLWWSCFMRDRLVAFGTRGAARIDVTNFNVRMLTIDDFEIEPLSNDNRSISFECPVMREIQMQRDLAALCIAKAKLCLFISHALVTQYPVFANSQEAVHEESVSERPCFFMSQEGSDNNSDARHCYAGLMEWADNLPIQCRYLAPTMEDVEGGRSCVFVNRALLHMLHAAVVSAVQKKQLLQTAEIVTHDLHDSSRQDISDGRLRLAACQISSISKDLASLNLARYLPPSGITVLLYAITIHLLGANSPDDIMRKKAVAGFSECVAVMESLRASYASADYACRFLDVAKQQIQFASARTDTSNLVDGVRQLGGLSISKHLQNIAPLFSTHNINIDSNSAAPISDPISSKSALVLQSQASSGSTSLDDLESSQSESISPSPSPNEYADIPNFAQNDSLELLHYEKDPSASFFDSVLPFALCLDGNCWSQEQAFSFT